MLSWVIFYLKCVMFLFLFSIVGHKSAQLYDMGLGVMKWRYAKLVAYLVIFHAFLLCADLF